MNVFRGLGLAVLLTLAQACSCGKTCTQGTLSCPCKAGAVCDMGLVCGSDGKCGGVTAKGVHIADPAARGCELVLTEGAGTSVANVTFSNGLKGSWVREAPKVAVTFVAGADQAIADGAVQLGLTGANPAVSLAIGSCVDVHGSRLAGTPVMVQQ
jgi:hypothetical protein